MSLPMATMFVVVLFIALGLLAAATVAAKAGLLGPVARAGKDGPGEFLLDVRPCIFSAAEAKFYGELAAAAAGLGLQVFPKVGLNDVFKDRSGAPRGQYNRYAQMHVDFLLVAGDGFRPVAGVELDGESHQGARQQKRDEKKAAVFKAAGVPLLRFYNQVAVGQAELRQKLEDCLALEPAR